MKRVVYTDPRWVLDGEGRIDPALADIEDEVYGAEIELHFGLCENGRFVTAGSAFLERIRGAHGVLVSRTVVTAELADTLAPSCRIVGRQGIGFDTLHPELLAARGIYAFHVSDYCTSEVADHTLALLLALERNVCTQNASVKAGRWNTEGSGRPRRLSGLTVGIVGVGRIGRATARKLATVYGKIIGYDPYVHPDLMAGYGIGAAATLDALLVQSDAVVLHALLTEETRGLMNKNSVARMKPGAMLVNTARGGLVDPPAVLEALRAGRMRGFASDVFDPEDPNDDPVAREILSYDRVIASAHCAFLSVESERSVRRRAAETIRRAVLDGEPPRFDRLA